MCILINNELGSHDYGDWEVPWSAVGELKTELISSEEALSRCPGGLTRAPWPELGSWGLRREILLKTWRLICSDLTKPLSSWLSVSFYSSIKAILCWSNGLVFMVIYFHWNWSWRGRWDQWISHQHCHQHCQRGQERTSWNQTACWQVCLQMEKNRKSFGGWLANRRFAGTRPHLSLSTPNSQTGSLTAHRQH